MTSMINRDSYLQQLVRKQWNGRIKIITGIRRCGKSTLLFDLFRAYLVSNGVSEKNIIAIALDDDLNSAYRDTEVLSRYVHSQCCDQDEKYYLFIDEIQYSITSEEMKNPDQPVRIYSVLNGFLHRKNIDVYVTGSNSKLLSKDVMTEFRGRGDVVQVYPLSFREFYMAKGLDKSDAYDEYSMYGGMPYLLNLDKDEDKFDYLENLFDEIYFKDIEERYDLKFPGVLKALTNALCSAVGSLTNASRIARTIGSVMNTKTDSETVSRYLAFLKDSFLFSESERYDVKGRKYFEYPTKFYCTDIGLRNVRLGLRQQEETHIMENIIYNELLVRGFKVDVGVVPVEEKDNEGRRHQKSLEIDFIARKGVRKYYIQSAFSMTDADKEQTETRPLRAVDDSFRKIIVSRTYGKYWIDEDGILRIGLLDFLLDEDSLDR